ncbi:MAG: cell division protein SepF [Candidatus Aenigmarchaeota archaeon]|nr:cell division protein SepF [Candidatus Aenigmarchaeota archaeon]
MGFFSSLKEKFVTPKYEEMESEGSYLELDSDVTDAAKSKVLVRPFILQDFEDIKPILDSLREGYTIALVNIKPLKDKDIVELKRAVNKLKKTTDAIEGEIAGFGEDYIVATPAFASIHRSRQTQELRTEEEVKE